MADKKYPLPITRNELVDVLVALEFCRKAQDGRRITITDADPAVARRLGRLHDDLVQRWKDA